MNYNYAAAYTQYASGFELKDISHELAIPLEVLKRRAREEGWSSLVHQLPHGTNTPVKAERDIQAIVKNRQRVMELANRLMTDLEQVTSDLLSGELLIEKVTSKGERVMRSPDIGDRRTLVAALKEVAEVSFRALGDVPEKAGREGGQGTGSGISQKITLVLPTVVAQPRGERMQVVDVDQLEDPDNLVPRPLDGSADRGGQPE